jgi:hypothetical protein
MRRDFRSEGVRWHSCRHPSCCEGMDVVVVVMSSQGVVPMPLLIVHGHVHHIDGSEYRGWGSPWLPVLPEGSTCPSSEAKMRRGGSGTFDDAAGARAKRRDVTRDTYRA